MQFKEMKLVGLPKLGKLAWKISEGKQTNAAAEIHQLSGC